MDAATATSKTVGFTSSVALPYSDIHETHTGVVVLVGDRAYKGKKPVLTDFLDFRSSEQRERACLREVELNSRLAAGSYLGVCHIDDPAGGLPEPVIVMRRYRDVDRLSAIATCGSNNGDAEPIRDILNRIALVISDFHDQAEHGAPIDTQGTPEAIWRRWRENLDELRHDSGAALSDDVITHIDYLAGEFIAGRAELFARRIADLRIVDGHGDLLADDIFWVDDQPVILDCLEFDDKLRYVDGIDDCAFLAMDLEFLGRADLGDFFMERSIAHSRDSAPRSLVHFYVAYRALVRAKVDCVRHSQGRARAALDAALHLAIATRHLQDGAVRLAMVGGNPGTGKSTVAQALAKATGSQTISTDDVRRELYERGDITGESGVLNSGLYSPANVRIVYEAVLGHARRHLAQGNSVILDATWRDAEVRAMARSLAAENHAALVEYVCTATAEAATDRINSRQQANSDATPEIAAALAASDDSWQTACALNTLYPLEDSLPTALAIWRRAARKE